MAKSFLPTALVLYCGLAFAAYTPPQLTSPVMDLAGLLPARLEKTLNNGLQALRNRGGSQLQVLTLPSLEGMTIEQVSIETTDQWQLGDKDKDNGVLLLVALKERKIRIEVGQGLEGVLPDATAWKIIEDVMVPLFRSGRAESAIMMGLLQIAKKTDPQFDFEALLNGQGHPINNSFRRKPSKGERIFTILFLLFFIYLFFRRPALFVAMGAGNRYGGDYGMGSGSWRGGGGWGGGGGGFSGGGASGGW